MNKVWLYVAGLVVLLGAAVGAGVYFESGCLMGATVSPTPASSPSTSIAATPTPANAPMKTAAGVPRCSANQLSLSLGQQQGTAGTLYTPLVWMNKSKENCTVDGYPAVALYDSNGKPVGLPASDDTSKTPAMLTVAPGATVHATVGTHDPGAYPPGTCSGLSFKVRGTLPADSAYETATFEETYCGKWLVSPMLASSTD